MKSPDYNNHTVCADILGRFFINLAVESSALLQTEDEPEKHISNEQDGKNGPYKFPRKLWESVAEFHRDLLGSGNTVRDKSLLREAPFEFGIKLVHVCEERF